MTSNNAQSNKNFAEFALPLEDEESEDDIFEECFSSYKYSDKDCFDGIKIEIKEEPIIVNETARIPVSALNLKTRHNSEEPIVDTTIVRDTKDVTNLSMHPFEEQGDNEKYITEIDDVFIEEDSAKKNNQSTTFKDQSCGVLNLYIQGDEIIESAFNINTRHNSEVPIVDTNILHGNEDETNLSMHLFQKQSNNDESTITEIDDVFVEGDLVIEYNQTTIFKNESSDGVINKGSTGELPFPSTSKNLFIQDEVWQNGLESSDKNKVDRSSEHTREITETVSCDILNNKLFDIKKEDILKVMGKLDTDSESNTEPKKTVYPKSLSTSEQLCVCLKREDLSEIQKSYKAKSFTKSKKRFRCKSCSYTATRKYNLLIHILGNHQKLAAEMKIPPAENMFAGQQPQLIWFKCTDCGFLAKYKSTLAHHIQRSHSEVELFSQKKKRNVEQLERSHNKPTARNHLPTDNNSKKLYKCPLCPFQTPNKVYLENDHLLLHKRDEKKRRYHCAHCLFKGKTRTAIIKHLLIHKRPDDLMIYKCDKCSFRSKHKHSMMRHGQVHRDRKELNLVPCSFCSYQGRTREHLREHVKRQHQSVEEGTIYKCDLCSYQNRNSFYVYRHRGIHKRPTDITVYHCSNCDYETKRKQDLRLHFHRAHTSPKEIQWHKCDQCELQFRQPWVLKRHMNCHKDSDEKEPIQANLFYCYHCPYYTKRKEDLARHMPKHTNVFLHYNQCNFQTRYQSCMLRHTKDLH